MSRVYSGDYRGEGREGRGEEVGVSRVYSGDYRGERRGGTPLTQMVILVELVGFIVGRGREERYINSKGDPSGV